AANIIEENLRAVGLTIGDSGAARLMVADAGRALGRLIEDRQTFDLVFFDPPYESSLYETVMKQLGSGRLLTRKAVVVVEHRTKNATAERYGVVGRYRELKQGESSLSFYESG